MVLTISKPQTVAYPGLPEPFRALVQTAVPRTNPLGIAFDALRGAAPGPSKLVPFGLIEHRAANHGISAAMLVEALENWESLGAA